MNDSTFAELHRFAARDAAAQAAVDLSIQRANLVASISRRRRAVERARLERDDAVTDAQLKLAMAVTALEDFDRRAGEGAGMKAARDLWDCVVGIGIAALIALTFWAWVAA